MPSDQNLRIPSEFKLLNIQNLGFQIDISSFKKFCQDQSNNEYNFKEDNQSFEWASKLHNASYMVYQNGQVICSTLCSSYNQALMISKTKNSSTGYHKLKKMLHRFDVNQIQESIPDSQSRNGRSQRSSQSSALKKQIPRKIKQSDRKQVKEFERAQSKTDVKFEESFFEAKPFKCLHCKENFKL